MRAAVAYDAIARCFILRIKFGRRMELLGPLARQLACSIRAAGMEQGCTLVTAVPSDPLTDLRRGFSPSRELASLLAKELGLELRRSLLSRRLFGGGVLKRLGASGRRRRAERIFRINGLLDGATVLLVDDIMTTGASLEACARLLKAAGAGAVRGAIWARALPGQD